MDVARFVLRRIFISVPVLIVASFIVFVIAANMGNPLANLLLNPKTPKSRRSLAEKAKLHLNDGVFQRYGIWVSHFVRG